MQEFVGIPYIPHGRDYAGADCWGLVWLFYRDVLKIDIPSYSDEMLTREFSRSGIAPLMQVEAIADWVEQDSPDLGHVVLMRRGRECAHVGIYAGDGLVLHTEGPGPSVIERISSPALSRRIAGFYFPKAKTC